MKSDKDSAVEKIAQIIGLIAQSFAIIAWFILILLFMLRIITCLYYDLPIIYNSLSLFNSLPIALVALPVAVYAINYYDSVIDAVANKALSIEKDIQNAAVVSEGGKAGTEGGSEGSSKPLEDIFLIFYEELLNSSDIDKFWFSFDLIQPFSFRLIRRISERITWDKEKKRFAWEKGTNTKDKSIKTIEIKINIKTIFWGLSLFILFVFALNAIWIYNLGPATYTADISKFVISLCWLIAFVLIILVEIFLISWLNYNWMKEVFVTSKKEIDNNDEVRNQSSNYSSRIVALANSLKAKSTPIIMSILIFGAISSIVATLKVGHLTLYNRYGIVELINGENTQQYAIVLDLDDYYVIEPAEESGSNLIIETGQYEYVDKDNVIVTRRAYNKSFVKR